MKSVIRVDVTAL